MTTAHDFAERAALAWVAVRDDGTIEAVARHRHELALRTGLVATPLYPAASRTMVALLRACVAALDALGGGDEEVIGGGVEATRANRRNVARRRLRGAVTP